MLVKIYAGEITKTRVRANLLDPGIVRTRLRARAFPGEDPTRLPPPDSVTDTFLDLALPECTRTGQVVKASGVSSQGNEGAREDHPRHGSPARSILCQKALFCRCSVATRRR